MEYGCWWALHFPDNILCSLPNPMLKERKCCSAHLYHLGDLAFDTDLPLPSAWWWRLCSSLLKINPCRTGLDYRTGKILSLSAKLWHSEWQRLLIGGEGSTWSRMASVCGGTSCQEFLGGTRHIVCCSDAFGEPRCLESLKHCKGHFRSLCAFCQQSLLGRCFSGSSSFGLLFIW